MRGWGWGEGEFMQHSEACLEDKPIEFSPLGLRKSQVVPHFAVLSFQLEHSGKQQNK